MKRLSAETDEAKLAKMFGKYGKVIRVTIPVWKGTTKKRGFAIIEYAAIASVEKSLELDGTTIDGKNVEVKRMEDVMNTKVKNEKQQNNEGKKKKKSKKNKKAVKKDDEEEVEEVEKKEENEESEKLPKEVKDE